MENKTIIWLALYDCHIKEINADLIDILELHIDNETDEIIDKENEKLLENDDRDEFWLDWIFLAGMGLNIIINCSSDLGSRDMNQNYDWINDTRQWYSNIDLIEADSFVSRVSINGQKDEGNKLNTMDYETLNEKQKIVFNWIEFYYNSILKGH